MKQKTEQKMDMKGKNIMTPLFAGLAVIFLGMSYFFVNYRYYLIFLTLLCASVSIFYYFTIKKRKEEIVKGLKKLEIVKQQIEGEIAKDIKTLEQIKEEKENIKQEILVKEEDKPILGERGVPTIKREEDIYSDMPPLERVDFEDNLEEVSFGVSPEDDVSIIKSPPAPLSIGPTTGRQIQILNRQEQQVKKELQTNTIAAEDIAAKKNIIEVGAGSMIFKGQAKYLIIVIVIIAVAFLLWQFYAISKKPAGSSTPSQTQSQQIPYYPPYGQRYFPPMQIAPPKQPTTVIQDIQNIPQKILSGTEPVTYKFLI